MSVTLNGMSSSDDPSASWDRAEVVDVRAEALDVVAGARRWQTTEARWQAIAQLLAAIEAAVTAGDADALAAATADLELAGPLRIRKIGTIPVVPAPEPVIYRLNRLVHALGGTAPEPQDQAGQHGTGDGHGAAD
jgi:hypothetical protein